MSLKILQKPILVAPLTFQLIIFMGLKKECGLSTEGGEARSRLKEGRFDDSQHFSC